VNDRRERGDGKATRVQSEGGISETSSDISPNWKDMRGYMQFCPIVLEKEFINIIHHSIMGGG
jgi:hypothetical protein